jgi:subtilisin family serine protease
MPNEQDSRSDKPEDAGELEQSDPKKKPFLPQNLDRTVIAIPLLRLLEKEIAERENAKVKNKPVPPFKSHKVIIDLNLEFPGGRNGARRWVEDAIDELVGANGNKDLQTQKVNKTRSDLSPQYVFAALEGTVVRDLVRKDTAAHPQSSNDERDIASSPRAIYHIWPDFPIRALTNKSISTVKADAARASFNALGDGIVWAVMDSGIDASHPHFSSLENLKLGPPLEPLDFTGEDTPESDPNGHGTHVAGIIAGQLDTSGTPPKSARAFVRSRNEHGDPEFNGVEISAISGMAPKCKLLSLRVLDKDGAGDVSALIAAIGKIQEINGYGRRLLIHGVNISIGNDFEPEWFACGQSPLCTEVNRLVSSGVVVVVAAGNSGYGSYDTKYSGVVSAGISLTINDPGNADQAITVGSTHRDMPHIYGVSYFSSKGPTGDGRLKPDLVAPGEKIISCAAGKAKDAVKNETGADCDYVEDSGTSMSAPHVSGVIAAFLSIRREFIGQPDKVKEIFLSTATDLKRERYFQGRGLVDLMRAIQSV